MFRELEKADIEARNRAEFMNQINLKGKKTPRKTTKKKKQKKRTPTVPQTSEWPEPVQIEKLNYTTKNRSLNAQKIVDNPSEREIHTRKRNLSSYTPTRLSHRAEREFHRAKSSLNLKNSDFHIHRASVGNLGLQKQSSGDGFLGTTRNFKFDATPGRMSRQS